MSTRIAARKGHEAMNTSKLSLLLGASGLAVAALAFTGCSSPAEGDDDDNGPGGMLPTGNPFGAGGQGGSGQAAVNPGQGGAPAVNPVAQGGGAAVAQGGSTALPTGGSGGAPVGTGEIPIGTGLAITPAADGFVQGMSNGLGIQGAFFAASDATSPAGAPTGTGSAITLNTMTPGSICVSGNLAIIAPNPAAATDPLAEPFLFSTYWGATLGLNLRQVIPAGGGMAQPASAWPRVTPAGQVTGFSYTITPNAGTTVPPLRFTVDYVGKPAGATFCSPLPVGGGTSALFANVAQSCWAPGGTPLPGADLLTIQFSLVSSELAATTFDFCISNLQAVVGP